MEDRIEWGTLILLLAITGWWWSAEGFWGSIMCKSFLCGSVGSEKSRCCLDVSNSVLCSSSERLSWDEQSMFETSRPHSFQSQHSHKEDYHIIEPASLLFKFLLIYPHHAKLQTVFITFKLGNNFLFILNRIHTSVHWHVTPARVGVQVPPFRHGLSSQWCTSISQLRPVKQNYQSEKQLISSSKNIS